MEQTAQKRNQAVDTARGIAAVLTVIGHLGWDNFMDQFIFSFHVPLFFVISGMTMRQEENLAGYIDKRFRRILIPYIVFSFLFSQNGLNGYLLCLWGSRESLLEAGSQTALWFLPCLFIADILFQLILHFCNDRNGRILISFLLAGLGLLLHQTVSLRYALPFCLDSAMIAVPFLLFGYELNRIQYINTVLKGNRTGIFLSGMILLAAVFFLYPLNLPPSVSAVCNHVELSICSVGNVPLFYLTAACGSLSVLLFSEWIGNRAPVLREFGMMTLTCLAFHRFIILLVFRAGGMLSMNRILLSVLATAVCVAGTFLIHRFLESYIPNLIGKH